MSGLTVNGVSVPAMVERGVVRNSPELIGPADERSFQGDLLSAVRARKEVLDVRLALQDAETATAWRRWLIGLGDTWTFDDATFGLYSSKGRTPVAGYVASRGTTAPTPKWGSGRLTVTTAITWADLGFRGWDAVLDGRTVLCWRWDGAAWKHHIIRDDWLMWVDGATSQVATPWLLVSGTALPDDSMGLASKTYYNGTFQTYATGQEFTVGERARVVVGPTTYIWRCVYANDPSPDGVGGNLGSATAGTIANDNYISAVYQFLCEGTEPGTGAGDTYCDDVIYLPFRVPTTWASEIYAEHSARAWSALPAVRVSGDVLASRAIYMEGQLQEATIRPAAMSGTWSNGVQDVGALLREV